MFIDIPNLRLLAGKLLASSSQADTVENRQLVDDFLQDVRDIQGFDDTWRVTKGNKAVAAITGTLYGRRFVNGADGTDESFDVRRDLERLFFDRLRTIRYPKVLVLERAIGPGRATEWLGLTGSIHIVDLDRGMMGNRFQWMADGVPNDQIETILVSIR